MRCTKKTYISKVKDNMGYIPSQDDLQDVQEYAERLVGSICNIMGNVPVHLAMPALGLAVYSLTKYLENEIDEKVDCLEKFKITLLERWRVKIDHQNIGVRMGTDIHLYTEHRVKEKWQKIKVDGSILPDDRNYRLFAFLANVRNFGDITPQFESRGIPSDTSYIENDEDWIGDYGLTYAYVDEIINAPWEDVGLQDCYFKIFYERILPRIINEYPWCDKEQLRNVRVLMGFDN